MMPSQVVLDPGHGGLSPAGRSTPHGVGGAHGASEKNITLDLARLLRIELTRRGHRVVLTREADRNLPLAARVRLARNRNAEAFLSLHCDGTSSDEPAAQAWIHTQGSPASAALARAVCQRLQEVATHF